jgi:hypothetical protein
VQDGRRAAIDHACMPRHDDALTSIPNVGPAIARKLRALDVTSAGDLRGRDPEELFERLCALDGRRHDPCLLDTFVAAVDYANGGPPRPWWEYSRERKARAG